MTSIRSRSSRSSLCCFVESLTYDIEAKKWIAQTFTEGPVGGGHCGRGDTIEAAIEEMHRMAETEAAKRLAACKAKEPR